MSFEARLTLATIVADTIYTSAVLRTWVALAFVDI